MLEPDPEANSRGVHFRFFGWTDSLEYVSLFELFLVNLQIEQTMRLSISFHRGLSPLLAFPWVALLLCFSFGLKAEKPNVIVIMADDLGYGDISAYGTKSFRTPNIDQLAAEGQRFTSGYCSASTCTPTRYSMLTGTYAFRKPNTGIAPPNSPALIQPGTETLPSLADRLVLIGTAN